MASAIRPVWRRLPSDEYNHWIGLRNTDMEERWSSAASVPRHIREYERVRWALVRDDYDDLPRSADIDAENMLESMCPEVDPAWFSKAKGDSIELDGRSPEELARLEEQRQERQLSCCLRLKKTRWEEGYGQVLQHSAAAGYAVGNWCHNYLSISDISWAYRFDGPDRDFILPLIREVQLAANRIADMPDRILLPPGFSSTATGMRVAYEEHAASFYAGSSGDAIAALEQDGEQIVCPDCGSDIQNVGRGHSCHYSLLCEEGHVTWVNFDCIRLKRPEQLPGYDEVMQQAKASTATLLVAIRAWAKKMRLLLHMNRDCQIARNLPVTDHVEQFIAELERSTEGHIRYGGY